MSVARQAAHGVAWNMLFGVGSRVLQLVGVLVLTHWIAPEKYGPVIAASILVTTASMLTSFAFGQYLIAKRAPPEVAFQALIVHVGLGVAAMAVVYVLRHPLGEFFGTPETYQYVLGFTVAVMLDRSRYIPERLLLRALRFRAVAAINATGELAYITTALAAAKLLGPNAIVLGWLVRSSLTCALYFRTAPRAEWAAPARLRGADVGNLFGYGLPIMIGSISDHLATRFDNLIMSKLFNAAVMARYNLSYSLAEMPVNAIAVQIGDVLMPAFSKMEDEQRRSAVVRAASLMSLIVSPLGVGLAAVSATLVAAFFDQKWGPEMAPMLGILATTGVVRPMTWSAVAYLQSVQKTRLIMYSSFFRAIVVLSLVGVCGYLGGENWACIGAAVGFALHSLLTIIGAGRIAGFSAGAYLLGVGRPLLPCVPMYLAVVGAQGAMAELGVPLLVSLVGQVVVGAVVYVGSALVLLRSSVQEFVRLGRDALRKRRGKAD
ncbi:MAG TPA: oligosaccharide flippase family protein [Kofleriaceae bacterium]|nr:oligosaccharide flippase family protein [Kofleriaceae bacterium]